MKRSASRRATSAISLAIVALIVSSTPSLAAVPGETQRVQEAQRILSTDPFSRTFRTAAELDSTDKPEGYFSIETVGPGWEVTCTGVVNNPHNSSGAGGAIFKTVIACKGFGKTQVNPKVQGQLKFAASPSATQTSNLNWQVRATSVQNQYVTVNGASKTFYTPLPGSNGGHGTGFWDAIATWWFAEGAVYSNVGSDGKLIFASL